jgi:hypothetical protein
MNDPTYKFEVGEPLPISIPQDEGLFPLLSGETILLAFIAQNLSKSEIHKIRSRPMMIGIRVEESVPFIVMGVQKWGAVDGSMNPYQYEERYRNTFIEGTGNLLQITLAEAPRQIIRANRAVGLTDEWMKRAREGYKECIKTYETAEAVNAAVGRVYNRYSTPQDLLAAADVTDRFT